MAKATDGKKVHSIAVGSGLYTAELASSIPDGYLTEADNFIASGQSLENRAGLTQTTIPYQVSRSTYNVYNRLYSIEHPSDTQASVAWANLNVFHFIRSGNYLVADPYITVTIAALNANGDVSSFVRYKDVVYFVYNDYAAATCKLYKITAFDWALDSITYSLVLTLPAIMDGSFFFKDRMWFYSEDKLFYTELVTIAAPNPENLPSTNYIRFNAHKGYYSILQAVPLGNRLLVFTKGGMYSLLVEGPPPSWSRKLLDASVRMYSGQCAFEANGLVYYASNTGVYVTNGLYSTKISSVIEDVFTSNTNDVRPSLHYFQDGMLLTFHRLVKNAAGTGLKYDGLSSKAYYSKLDPVAWTRWTINDPTESLVTFNDQYLAEVHSVLNAISTGLSNTPLTLLSLTTTRSTVATGDLPGIQQLCVYDGGDDTLLVQNAALAIVPLTQPVILNFVTRFTDADAILFTKRSFEAYIEIYSSDVSFNFTTQFEIDGFGDFVATLPTTSATVGSGVNLVRITADFRFRRVAAHFNTVLGSDTNQVKVTSIHLLVDETRLEFERVR